LYDASQALPDLARLPALGSLPREIMQSPAVRELLQITGGHNRPSRFGDIVPFAQGSSPRNLNDRMPLNTRMMSEGGLDNVTRMFAGISPQYVPPQYDDRTDYSSQRDLDDPRYLPDYPPQYTGAYLTPRPMSVPPPEVPRAQTAMRPYYPSQQAYQEAPPAYERPRVYHQQQAPYQPAPTYERHPIQRTDQRVEHRTVRHEQPAPQRTETAEDREARAQLADLRQISRQYDIRSYLPIQKERAMMLMNFVPGEQASRLRPLFQKVSRDGQTITSQDIDAYSIRHTGHPFFGNA